jgi:PIN domain nuclease of toxin-antitoxin system
MTMLVLDTHAVLWWTLEPARLGREARRHLKNADRIGIPSICFWEASLLVRKGKLELDLSMVEWARSVCSIPRVDVLPLELEIALLADTLDMHPDPADRFIVATAMTHRAPLATKDESLRALKFLQSVW